MNKELKNKLSKIKALFLDADGVFFTGHEHRTVTDGKVSVTKTRHFIDGQGISFLRELGIKIVFVTGEGEPLESIVLKINNLPSAENGRWAPVEMFTKQNGKGEKIARIREWLLKNDIDMETVAYMGDDVNDIEPMKIISEEGGVTCSPANVMRKTRPYAMIVTKASGGNGAIRELAEMIIDAKEADESNFPPA